ncbi:MAG: hypothetical protein M1821_003029 [Bathelium mastoideum]|nr:MAG: hypothetical protein M1821_003029 [Bathelium mastoideum]
MAQAIFLASLRSLFDQSNYSDFTEASSSNVGLKDDPDVVHAMLKFLYNFKYNDDDVTASERMPFAVQVFIIADKYDIEPLKEQATDRFMALTERPPCGNAFSRAVRLIYENTLDKGTHELRLRNDAVNYAWAKYHELVTGDGGFKQVLDEVCGFGSNMVSFEMEKRGGSRASRKKNVKKGGSVWDLPIKPKKASPPDEAYLLEEPAPEEPVPDEHWP